MCSNKNKLNKKTKNNNIINEDIYTNDNNNSNEIHYCKINNRYMERNNIKYFKSLITNSGIEKLNCQI